MKTYIIYFEVFGKKMKTEIEADSAKSAKDKVLERVYFHKIEVKPDVDVTDGSVFQNLIDIVNGRC